MQTCPDCSAEVADDLAQCPSCKSVLDATVEVGAARTAVRGSANDVPSGRNTTIIVSGPARRIGAQLGSYRLLEVIGEGGMGAVYLAEHVKLGRKVALKTLHEQYARSPDVVRRFFAEARAVNKIFHEHIVEITDFVENDRGANYYIMEYLKGLPLTDLVEREGALPLSRSIGVVVQVCSALSAVHAAGIVHRDLKPDNIFLIERAGQMDFVKLLDFGIAKLLDTDGQTINLATTAAGMIMGTPEYMSPEQARGKSVDYRTDIYSLGVILYELATGTKPFIAETFGEMVVKLSTEAPPPPSEVPHLFQQIPRDLEELILQCLEKEPQKRPPSTKEIEDRLRAIASTYAVQLERFDLSRPAMPRKTRRRLAIAGTAVAVAAAAALLVTRLVGPGDGARAPEPPAPVATAAPAPTAIVVPAAADQVPTETLSIDIESLPVGASVFLAGETTPAGVTPFRIDLPRGDGEQGFRVEAAGYQAVERVASLRRDAQLSVMLAAAPAPASGRRTERVRPPRKAAPGKPAARDKPGADEKIRKPGLKEGAVMNPFAK
ncbi:MAG TPA: serine/threonine-protein kinase [Kofleriaceae bacterium]|nr:serine/threonine-protein kinase [Kofleriaceae bacterium]